jgi:hypothetical protein
MQVSDLPDNGRATPHRDAGRGVEIGLASDERVRVASGCDWFISDRHLLAIKDEHGMEIAHFARDQWVWVSHPGVVTVEARL